jgi:hypothetical protein
MRARVLALRASNLARSEGGGGREGRERGAGLACFSPAPTDRGLEGEGDADPGVGDGLVVLRVSLARGEGLADGPREGLAVVDATPSIATLTGVPPCSIAFRLPPAPLEGGGEEGSSGPTRGMEWSVGSSCRDACRPLLLRPPAPSGGTLLASACCGCCLLAFRGARCRWGGVGVAWVSD